MTEHEKQQLLVPFPPTPFWVKAIPFFFITPGIILITIAWFLPWTTGSRFSEWHISRSLNGFFC